MIQTTSPRSPAYGGVIDTTLLLLTSLIVHRKGNVRDYFSFPSIQVEQKNFKI